MNSTLTEQIKEKIFADFISTNESGKRIPTEAFLKNNYNVSLTTIRRAVGILENEKILERCHGSGTFIRKITTNKKVGLLVPEGNLTSYFREMAIRVEPYLRQENFSTSLFVAPENYFDIDEIRHCLGDADALILCGYCSNYRELRSLGLPIIIMGNELPVDESYVAVDMICAMKSAISHLVETGCHRIHLFTQWQSSDPQKDIYNELSLRYFGYRLGLEQHDLNFSPDMIHHAGFSYIHGYNKCMEVIDKKSFDAVICANDRIALGVIKALSEKGFSVPGDVSVVGCNNIMSTEEQQIPLTTIDFRIDVLVSRVVYLLNNSFKNNGLKNEDLSILVKPKLIIRNSTK